MENSCKGKKGGCLATSDTGSTASEKYLHNLIYKIISFIIGLIFI